MAIFRNYSQLCVQESFLLDLEDHMDDGNRTHLQGKQPIHCTIHPGPLCFFFLNQFFGGLGKSTVTSSCAQDLPLLYAQGSLLLGSPGYQM